MGPARGSRWRRAPPARRRRRRRGGRGRRPRRRHRGDGLDVGDGREEHAPGRGRGAVAADEGDLSRAARSALPGGDADARRARAPASVTAAAELPSSPSASASAPRAAAARSRPRARVSTGAPPTSVRLAVRGAACELEVVRERQRRVALGRVRAQQPDEPRARLVVHAARRLVEHEHARPRDERGGDGDALALTPGEVAGMAQPRAPRARPTASADATARVRSCAGQPSCLGPNPTSSSTRSRRRHAAGILRDEADAREALLDGARGDVLARETHAAARRRVQPAQHARERALAAAVLARERRHAAGCQRELGTGQHGSARVARRDPAQLGERTRRRGLEVALGVRLPRRPRRARRRRSAPPPCARCGRRARRCARCDAR